MPRDDQQIRTITFDTATLAIMVSMHANTDGTIRLDGWLSPAGSHPVELQSGSRRLSTRSDENGRFAIDHIPSGTVQLFIRPGGQDHTISTPLMTI